jgi:hypothetical protein
MVGIVPTALLLEGQEGVIVLTETEYERVEECMRNPGGPSAGNRRGAALLRKLAPRP